jgi:hypothetical protein
LFDAINERRVLQQKLVERLIDIIEWHDLEPGLPRRDAGRSKSP